MSGERLHRRRLIAKPPLESDGVAVIFGERSLTYGQLEDRAERLAAGLAAAGFRHLETLWSSGTVVLHETDRPFDPEHFCELVERHRVTSVALVPTVLRRLLALDTFSEHDLSSLRVAIVGGESVPTHLMEEIGGASPISPSSRCTA